MTRVLIGIVLAAGCLSLFSSGRMAASSQLASPVVINWQVRLDDTTNFDFTRLSVSLQRRPGKPHAWTMVGSVTPDTEGRFVSSVPAGSWISVALTTSDPTVQRSTDSPNDVEFYELGKNKTETIMRQEFYVPTDSPEQIERELGLRRGAAFSVCIPEGLKSGSIQFHRQSRPPEEGIIVWSFSDSTTIKDSVVGGLAPGPWRVLYVSDSDLIFQSDEIDLRLGEIFRQKCSKEERQR